MSSEPLFTGTWRVLRWAAPPWWVMLLAFVLGGVAGLVLR